MNRVYYNENDAHAAQWLRNLIRDGLIPEGDVDERSIADVSGDDVRGYSQCHFFAGIGGWPIALRLAGAEDLPCFSGSPPCQPFSVAGPATGESDARHLWPEFRRIIAECRPPTIFGEQVVSPLGRQWYARVRSDLEELGHAVGAADLCAAGAGQKAEGRIVRGNSAEWETILLGAPHIRQRLFWVAHAHGGISSGKREQRGRQQRQQPEDGGASGLGDTNDKRRQGQRQKPQRRSIENPGELPCGVEHPASTRRERRQGTEERIDGDRATTGRIKGAGGPVSPSEDRSPWSDFDLLACTDGKSRRVEPGLQCLVDGLPFRLADGRTGKNQSRSKILRGIGNAIVPHVAAIFIKAYLDYREIHG